MSAHTPPAPEPPPPEPHLAATIRGASERPQRYAHDAMACTFEVYIFDEPARSAAAAARTAFDELDRLEAVLSRFRPESDISQINRVAVGELVRVQAETRECLELAAQLFLATGGALDISFASEPAARPGLGAGATPPLLFDPQAHGVRVQSPGLRLDLGAVGKGYALDRLVAVLREWGVARAVVQSGHSTVVAVGGTGDGGAWRLGLRDPADPEAPRGWIGLRDGALAGSGQILHGAHIVDPRSGRAVPAQRAAWALAERAAVADGLSTAFMILGPREVEAVCARRPGVGAVLLRSPDEGLLRFGAAAEANGT